MPSKRDVPTVSTCSLLVAELFSCARIAISDQNRRASRKFNPPRELLRSPLEALSQLTEESNGESGRKRGKHTRPVTRSESADRVRVFSCKVVISWSTIFDYGQGAFTQIEAGPLFSLKANDSNSRGLFLSLLNELHHRKCVMKRRAGVCTYWSQTSCWTQRIVGCYENAR